MEKAAQGRNDRTAGVTGRRYRLMTKILIGIPVLDNIEMTRVCLESLIANTPAGDPDLCPSLLVVDNGSEDDIAGLLQHEFGHADLPIHHHRNTTNLGVAAAWNQILQFVPEGHDSGRYCYHQVVIANNDVIFGPDWLPPLLAAMAQDRRIGWVAALENGSPLAPQLLEAHELSRRHRLDPKDAPSADAIRQCVRRVYAPWGGHAAFCRAIKALQLPGFIPFRGEGRSAVCFMIRTAMVEQIGEFDEDYAPVGIAEDLEYFLRMEGMLRPSWLTVERYPPDQKWRSGFCGQSVVHHYWCSTRQGPHFDGRRWDKIREQNWRAKFGRSRKHFTRLFD